MIYYRVLLIGGSSHSGKTALARALSSRLGWVCHSTDRLARHPGRPWQTPPRQVPDHVCEHYLSLSANDLVEDVLRHYRNNVWPLAETMITAHASDSLTDSLILEGSAILPDIVAALKRPNVAFLWLTASDELFKERIHRESQYDGRSSIEKTMIGKFLERTVLLNKRMTQDVMRLRLASVDVSQTANLDELCDRCLIGLETQDFRIPV